MLQETLVKDWLVETLPYEVMWLDETGKLLYANEKFRNRLGYNKAELLKLSIFDINPTVTQESWAKHWATVKREQTYYFKGSHKSKSGKFYEVEVFTQFFSNNRNNIICAIVNDISHSSFYKSLMDSTQDIANVGGWKLNLQDGSIIATTEALKIFNAEDSEALTPANIIHQFKDPEKIKNLLRGVMRTSAAYDEVLETKGHPSKFIRAVAKPVLKGDKVYKIVGVYQDITERQLKENNLQLFKEVIDNVEDLIYVFNRKGELIHYSVSVMNQLGYSKKQLESITIFKLDPTITEKWWKEHFNEIVDKGLLRFEWLALKTDGTKFPVEISANHLRYNGEDYNCAVIRNVTERKKRDLKLYEALEEIKSLKERLEHENEYLQEEISDKINADNIVCKSEIYSKVLEQVHLVAPTDTTVLITGESGTGKELLASAIHTNSLGKNRALIKVNCATLPKELIESELFGHKKGAFTGAVTDKVGKFTLADGGTIFLDEIGEMPIDLQSKLLRVLQEGEFDELGGTRTIKVDVRVIAATNRKLEDMIKEGTFREDLYYRLNVFPIYNIPLRERKEDIPLLAQFFLEKFSSKAGKAFKRLSKKTVDALMAYNYPGNIRELENLIERAVIVENGTTLNTGSWMPTTSGPIKTAELLTFEEAQKQHIIEVLKRTDGKVSGVNGAAGILDMNAKTLFAKMKKLGIEKQTVFKS
ncbi:PAS domain S-box-containing protein [Gelidibacter sediminis]|uniref:PAS domain S-box-containing protein n=1 Tax=Gelidibacter sediminis TaxID=1608710 RepID=A0A4R7PK39_9FLAO|nr:sigma 54-interacting transcriptional regulator [Gelidibacter sediminis]TDU34322.1 PAS domain S-box-containing protein [Gelidibacter sediminis]